SSSQEDVLNGANRLLVKTANHGWELTGFIEAELVGPGQYELRDLLRGLQGTLSGEIVEVGAPVMLVDGALRDHAIDPQKLGSTLHDLVFAGPNDLLGEEVLTPLMLAP